MKRKTSWNLAMKSNRWTRLRDVRSVPRIGLFRGSFPWRLQNFPRKFSQAAEVKLRADQPKKKIYGTGPLFPHAREKIKSIALIISRKHEHFHLRA
jgi:hypothetical protein